MTAVWVESSVCSQASALLKRISRCTSLACARCQTARLNFDRFNSSRFFWKISMNYKFPLFLTSGLWWIWSSWLIFIYAGGKFRACLLYHSDLFHVPCRTISILVCPCLVLTLDKWMENLRFPPNLLLERSEEAEPTCSLGLWVNRVSEARESGWCNGSLGLGDPPWGNLLPVPLFLT